MKRVIAGFAYNTETATKLAHVNLGNPDENEDVWDSLYVTRGGAYFLHHHVDREVRVERIGHFEPSVIDRIEPLGLYAVRDWALKNGVEIKGLRFDDPPEASAEAAPGATLYVRVPVSLKRRVDEAAKTDGVSVNVGAKRCLERCLTLRGLARPHGG